MGLYDTITFYADGVPTCAAGHQIASLQSKDLECEMADYAVYRDRLYRVGADGEEAATAGPDGTLILHRRRRADPLALTADITAYAHCERCRPVLYIEASGRAWGDYVQERQPWCESRLVVVAGAIERRVGVRLETRDSVAETLRREGIEVLDDADRLARLHFERRDQADRRHRW
jgi:hypothetical protein